MEIKIYTGARSPDWEVAEHRPKPAFQEVARRVDVVGAGEPRAVMRSQSKSVDKSATASAHGEITQTSSGYTFRCFLPATTKSRNKNGRHSH